MKQTIYNLLRKIKRRLLSNPPKVEIVSIKVAGKEVRIHNNNRLVQVYAQFPEFGQELGRLAQAIEAVYGRVYMLDIGANVGDTALLMRASCQSTIVCIEGDAIVYELLQQNTAQDKAMSTYCCFLGESNSNMQAQLSQVGTNLTIVPSAEGGSSIAIQTLDSFVQQHLQQQNIKLIKIDAEGYDFKILRGAATVLQQYKPVIYAEYNRTNTDVLGINVIDEWRYLSSLGYAYAMFYDPYGRFMLSCALANEETLEELNRYIARGAFQYFDCCLFHQQDKQLFDRFKQAEFNRS